MKFLLSIALAALAASAQTSDPPLTFAVSVIKPADPNANGRSMHFLPGGGLGMTNGNVKTLMMFAYDVRDFQVLGPSWIENSRFDITAKPDGAQAPANLEG